MNILIVLIISIVVPHIVSYIVLEKIFYKEKKNFIQFIKFIYFE